MNQDFLATRNFLCDEDGVTAIEYGLIASMIAIAVIVIVFLIGQQVQAFFIHLKDCWNSPSTCKA